MRQSPLILFGICAFFLAGVVATAAASNREIIRFAASSQVAEAYGMGIVKEFETMTGLTGQRYFGPTDMVVQRLVNGVSDIVAIDRPLPQKLKESGFVEIPFCMDAIAIITNTQCTLTQPCDIDNLSEKQVRGIFSGQIANWKELGGPDQRIIVIVPSKEEGAFQNFTELVMRINEVKYHFMASDAMIAVEAIKFVPGAISFVSNGALGNDQSIKKIKVNSLAPGEKDYPIHQTYAFATKGEPTGNVKDVINFGLSKRGVEIMKEKGMHPAF